MDEVCREFQSVVEGGESFSAWFGDEWKSNRRTLKRLIDDITKFLDGVEDMVEYDVLTRQKKRLQAMVQISDFANKSGVSHAGMLEVVDSQMHFLTLEPVAALRLPEYLDVQVFFLRARSCDDPVAFWQSIKACRDGQRRVLSGLVCMACVRCVSVCLSAWLACAVCMACVCCV